MSTDKDNLHCIEATIVEGEVSPDALYGALSPYNRDEDLKYQVKLVRKEPGNVEFLLTINGRICGQMPFDNLIKAQVRLDPDHASGPEKQIQKLRRETAEARAQMYDWQAKAMQLEERLKQYEAAEAVPSSRCICGLAMRAIGEHREDCPKK